MPEGGNAQWALPGAWRAFYQPQNRRRFGAKSQGAMETRLAIARSNRKPVPSQRGDVVASLVAEGNSLNVAKLDWRMISMPGYTGSK
jgi:hypothetical protein